jgi:hypothetical protein
MVDEDVARSLEQEAIALVSLSNPSKFAAAEGTESKTPEQEQEQDGLVDANISMKSLLVTLKKRKLQHQAPQQVKQEPAEETAAADDAKLPSFRAVFQPQPQQETPADDVPPELKCKYRTGKCHNARALKSCGDYHNLCNYHRLRANANQRKLDRKKKEQRLQQQQLTADALAGSSSPRALQQQQISHASSHAAAAALASLVAAQPQRHLDVLQQRPFFVSGVTVQEAATSRKTPAAIRPASLGTIDTVCRA